MGKFSAFLKLTRIEHSVLLVVAVIAAELISGGIPSFGIFVMSILSPALISMGAFAINDYFDVETDKANKRTERPLVSGAIKKESAYALAVILLLVGTALSFFINLYAFVIAAIFAGLAYLYSYKLKDVLLLGTTYIAFSMAIPFLYGNFVVVLQINPNIILISFVVFLSGFAREIHGMIRDRSGDSRIRRSRNLVHSIGVKKSAVFALILYVEGIAISLYMFVFMAPFKYNLVYIVPIVVANVILFYVAIGYLSKESRRFFDLSRNLSLAAMGIALLSYLISAIFYVVI